MKNYERMTKRDEYGRALFANDKFNEDVVNSDGISFEDLHYLSSLAEHLAELEDKIEDGRLFDLPCKVGDKVYSISCDIDDEYTIKEDVVWYFTIQDKLRVTTNYIGWGLFGEDVFLTHEEAEKKLQELKEINND